MQTRINTYFTAPQCRHSMVAPTEIPSIHEWTSAYVCVLCVFNSDDITEASVREIFAVMRERRVCAHISIYLPGIIMSFRCVFNIFSNKLWGMGQ